MSWEAWGEPPDDSDMNSDERVEEAFVAGAQACREMMARFVEQGGDAIIAGSIRANWHPDWGADPGSFTGPIPTNAWDEVPTQGTSASGQDPQGLEAKPAGPVAESDAPEPQSPQNHLQHKG